MVSDRLLNAFIDARLSLFTVRWTNEVSQVYECRKAQDQITQVIGRVTVEAGEESAPLLNQTSFLQFAYMSLVWLREVVVQELGEPDKAKIDEWFKSCVKSVLEDGATHAVDPSDTRTEMDLLRTLRNSISHGHVDFRDDQTVHFIDRTITADLTWTHLGYLSENYIYAVSNLIHGVPSEPPSLT